MKKLCILSLMILCLLLGGCRQGDVEEVKTSMESSKIYTEAEITAAMDVVREKFQKDFGGCTLNKLYYEEEFSLKEAEYWSDRFDGAQIIVLLSEFSVDESGGDGSLNPNSTYEHWSWILARSDADAKWELKDYGY